MDMSTAAFWGALLKIIGINIILSGDNAVVIAMACRNLPKRQQNLGIMLGAGAAVVLRIIFAILVASLLDVPYLKIFGALLLLWIGYKLLTEDDGDEDHIKASESIWGAVWTITVADAVMSLDNVLGIAAAANNDKVLIALGIAISVPLVVFGAKLLILLIERYPFIVTLGGALIGYVAGELLVTDTVTRDWVAPLGHAVTEWAIPIAVAVGLVVAARLISGRGVTEPASAGETIAAPAAIVAVRGILIATGELLIVRAPWILAVIAAAVGFGGASVALEDHAVRSWAEAITPIARTVGPILAGVIAAIIVRLLVGQRRSKRLRAD